MVRWLIADVPRPITMRVEPAEKSASGQTAKLFIETLSSEFEALDNVQVRLDIMKPNGEVLSGEAEPSKEQIGVYELPILTLEEESIAPTRRFSILTEANAARVPSDGYTILRLPSCNLWGSTSLPLRNSPSEREGKSSIGTTSRIGQSIWPSNRPPLSKPKWNPSGIADGSWPPSSPASAANGGFVAATVFVSSVLKQNDHDKNPEKEEAIVFRVRGVYQGVSMGEVAVHALRGIDLDLYPGEFVVILGASGSGKSTLLNILGVLDVPTEGTVKFRDHDLTSADEEERTRYRREHVGFVFQFYNLIAGLTALGTSLWSPRSRKVRCLLSKLCD